MCIPCRGDLLESEPYRKLNRVRAALAQAVKAGWITRDPCEVCGAAKADAHHDDYAKPLEVRWLCRKHHRLHHVKHGPGKNDFRDDAQLSPPTG